MLWWLFVACCSMQSMQKMACWEFNGYTVIHDPAWNHILHGFWVPTIEKTLPQLRKIQEYVKYLSRVEILNSLLAAEKLQVAKAGRWLELMWEHFCNFLAWNSSKKSGSWVEIQKKGVEQLQKTRAELHKIKDVERWCAYWTSPSLDNALVTRHNGDISINMTH